MKNFGRVFKKKTETINGGEKIKFEKDFEENQV